MALSAAERQRRRRIRQREERESAARRAEVREILARAAACACCGTDYIGFLTLLDDCVYCRNCAGVIATGACCPHRGVIARVG